MQERAAVLILGDQLFPIAVWREVIASGDLVLMAEDYELCARYRTHQIKIAFFLSAMRAKCTELTAEGFDVDYKNCEHIEFRCSFEEKLDSWRRDRKFAELKVMAVADLFLRRRLVAWAERSQVKLVWLKSPFFITQAEARQSYFKTKRPFMKNFYEAQRRRTRLLMTDTGQPLGGQFSFDEDNRKKLPKNLILPELPQLARSTTTEQVIAWVESHFADHPGLARNLWLPVDRRAAVAWLGQFVTERLAQFGPYEDALSADSVVIFHSVLSPLLNAGILLPDEVINLIIKAWRKNPEQIPLQSVEGIVRQIIGWREFIFGINEHHRDRQVATNFFNAQLDFNSTWHQAQTGVPPLDDVLVKVRNYAYAHHIERLMILGNTMLLAGIHPNRAYAWFMQNFVDSADWVMGPNVWGMALFSDGGIFATKPYICGANYWLKMSHYSKGSWCDELDGLYWGFIADHQKFFASQPRLNMMLRMLEKMKSDRRATLEKARSEFLKRNTVKLSASAC